MSQEDLCAGACIHLNSNFNVVHQASIKHEAAHAFSGLPTDRQHTTDLNDALLVLVIVLADRAKEAEGIHEKHHLVNEALEAPVQKPLLVCDCNHTNSAHRTHNYQVSRQTV